MDVEMIAVPVRHPAEFASVPVTKYLPRKNWRSGHTRRICKNCWELRAVTAGYKFSIEPLNILRYSGQKENQ